MQERINTEVALLLSRYPGVEYASEGGWVWVPALPLPAGWNRLTTDVAFQIPVSYPGTPPYGIYVPSGLEFESQSPDGFKDPAPTQPPFRGSWAIFSWQPGDGEWRAAPDINSGSNLLNWTVGFAARFKEGR